MAQTHSTSFVLTQPPPILLTFQVIQLKLFHNKLLVLDSICLQGWPNQISIGDRCLVHVVQGRTTPTTTTTEVRQIYEEILQFDNENKSTNNQHLFSSCNPKNSSNSTGWIQMIEPPYPSYTVRYNSKYSRSQTTTIERNRKGERFFECQCDDIFEIGHPIFEDTDENDDDNDDIHHGMQDGGGSSRVTSIIENKSERHKMFASWLVKTYGKDCLASGSGILDVAGGNGELSRALQRLGIPSIVVDPNPRIDRAMNENTNNDDDGVKSSIAVLPYALYGDGSNLTNRNDEVGEMVRACSFICGMHPDQATEPIVDMAIRLGVRFAVVPCCVMPSLFPFRRQLCGKGDPVRSYSAFCQYLLDKGRIPLSDDITGNDMKVRSKTSKFNMISIPFVGRNKVIFSPPPPSSSS